MQRIEAQGLQRLFGMLVAIGFAASAIITAVNLAQYSAAPSSKYAVYLVSDVGVALLLVGLFYLNRKGHTRLAGVMFLATCAVFLTFTFDFPDRGLWMYTIGSLIASFVISPASSFAFGAFSVLVYTAGYWQVHSPMSYNYYFLVGQIVVASVSWLAARQYQELVVQQEITRRAVTFHAQQMIVLYETSLEINAISDAQALLHFIVERASKLAGARAGALYLAPSGKDGCARLVSGYMLPEGTENVAGQPGSIARRALDTGESASTNGPLTEADEPLLACLNRRIGSELAVPLRVECKTLGALLILSDWGQTVSQNDAQLARLFCDQAAVVLSRAQLLEAVRQSNLQLQTLSRRLVEAQEDERRHIARELHDEIGQQLTGLKLMLEMSGRAPDSQIRYNLSEAEALADEALQQVREMSFALRPTMLDDLGLLPALTALFGRYTSQTRVQVVFKHVGLDSRIRFAPEIEITAYRVIQEALTNVARHAGVDRAQVTVWATTVLIAQVMDVGKGFDPDTVMAQGRSSGLSGMRERALSVGGQLVIESSPGGGTYITAELPLSFRPPTLPVPRTPFRGAKSAPLAEGVLAPSGKAGRDSTN